VGSHAGPGDASLAARPAEGPAPAFQLRLTGAFALHRQGQPIHLSISAQRLVAFLALSDGPTRRSHVAGTFWPDVSEDRAMANLRSVLWRFQRPAHDILGVDDGQLALTDDVVVDTRTLRRTALEILAAGETDYLVGFEDLVHAAEILPDWSDEWVVVDRERFHQLRLHALERLSSHLAATGRYGLAVEACLVVLAAEPLRESAQRQLIEVYLSEGNRMEALRQYSAYQRVIREEVGAEPSREISELVSRLAVAPRPRR
jgi:DNA-binding SARP family transcriptional activator